jgi:hypothetical protein
MPEHKISIHDEIFALSCNTDGGFNQDIVYNLPIYLRKFYLKRLMETRQKQKDDMKKQSSPRSGHPRIKK